MDYFDLHCDTPSVCFREDASFLENDLAVSGRQGDCFARWTQVFAIWISEDQPDPFAHYRRVLGDFKMKFSKPFCTAASEVEAPRSGILAVEGGALLEGDLSRLDQLYCDGVRSLTLTWNGQNEIASGCQASGGLTEFGKRVVARLNRLGIATDLSHLNPESFWDALERADWPIATHSCLQAYFEHPRNLTDEALKAIAKKGGIIGLCFYPAFFGGRAVHEALFAQIVHMLELGLGDAIALGSDFDGAEMDPMLCKVGQVPALYADLCEHGIEETILQGIFYENAARFFKKLLTNGCR